MYEITFLTVKQVIEIHEFQLLHNGGGLPGVRDVGLLESAVAAPLATFDKEFLYKGIFEMAAAYFLGLAKNHAFNDGNKRTAVAAVTIFLQMSGIGLVINEDDLVEFTVRVASEKIENQEIATFLEAHAVPSELDA